MAVITPSAALKTAILTAVNDALNAGTGAATIKLYTGTKPASPDTAVTTQTLLGTLVCSDPAGTVAGGSLTFGPITSDSAADASGTATWLRIADSDGVAVFDLDVTVTGSGGAAQMNTTSVVVGGPITAPSVVITL